MNDYRSVKGLPWSIGIGQDVTDCNTAEEVMHKTGLDFTVEKCPLVAKMPFSIKGNNEIDKQSNDFAHKGHIYRECAGAYATYRTDKNIPLGMVKSKYEVVQNIDAFKFFDDAIGIDKAQYQTAGYYGLGHKIFISAKIPADFDVSGDPVKSYLIFSNTHDGSGSISILFAPVRVFCTNMLNSAFDNADSYIRIRHTRTAKEKLERGSEILRIACKYAHDSKELYESLAKIKMSDKQVMEYIANLNLTEAERMALQDYDSVFGLNKLFRRDYYTLETTKISMRKANKIVAMWDYYHTGAGQNRIMGTAWGAYNAITGYFSNVDNSEGEKRMDTLCYGGANKVMNHALISAAGYGVAV